MTRIAVNPVSLPLSDGPAFSMDLELLRTFVEVYRCCHFGKAADRLYITQSAVSARIRQLENMLGCQLLLRERKQVHPTADGERFLPHAENLLKQWERVRRDMTESAQGGPSLRIGATPALWEAKVLDWLERFQRNHSSLRVRAASRDTQLLMPRLVEGALDLVLQFDPPRTEGVEHRVLGRLNLVLASAQPETSLADALGEAYVAVDWGGGFAAFQAELVERFTLTLDTAQLALGWLRRRGGAAYLPQEIAARENLFPVAGAPEFSREIHAVWRTPEEQRDLIEKFLQVAAESGKAQ